MNQMAVTAADIARILGERIEGSHPAPALFSATETDEWPAQVLHVLLECGVLKPTNRAESVWCPGCERQCYKSVVVRTLGGRTPSAAFITCDEEPGHGRIAVPLPSLVQHAATLSGVCGFLAGQMQLGPPRSSAAGACFLLGTIKGRHGPRRITVDLDAGQVMLHVGQQHVSVVSVLRWSGVGLSIDKERIQRLANRKDAASWSRVSRPPDRTMRHKRARNTRARHEAIFREAKRRYAAQKDTWTAIATAIAATDLAKAEQGRRISAATIRRIVTLKRRRECESFRSNRKSRKHL